MNRAELVSLIKETAGTETAAVLARYQEKSKDTAQQIISPEMRAANDSQGAMDRTLRNEQRGIALSGALCILAEARGNLKEALAISAGNRWKEVVGVQKILEAGTATSGGVLISPEHSQEIIDLLAPRAVVRRHISNSMDVSAGMVDIARMTSVP